MRLSSARLAQGCSASFVSPDGLVMTNHHCAHACIEQLSTAEKDLVKNGFTAKTDADELKCPEMEVNQLVEITDVTERVRKATAGLQDAKDLQKYNEAEKAELSRIEKECATSDDVRCDVVTLYRGRHLQPVQVPALPGRAAGVRARSWPSRSSAAIPTTSTSPATTWTSASCASTATASRPRWTTT